MYDSTKTFFFGPATDVPMKSDTPRPCPYAVDDVVYYRPDGERQGQIAFVTGYWLGKKGGYEVELNYKGKRIVTDLKHLHC